MTNDFFLIDTYDSFTGCCTTRNKYNSSKEMSLIEEKEFTVQIQLDEHHREVLFAKFRQYHPW